MSSCVPFILCFLVAGSCASSDQIKNKTSISEEIQKIQKPSLNNTFRSDIKKSSRDGNELEEIKKSAEEEVCFTQLGCFQMEKPWNSDSRPVGLPESPEKLQTRIQLYTQETTNEPLTISLYPEIDMDENFNSKKKSVMIVRGFGASESVAWNKDLKNLYLQKVDANVMIVDWGEGASKLHYFQAVASTRVVGKQLALFVQHLIKNYKADPGKFHLIGYSLGAHICSYLAKEVKGIGRITALDPAQPYFEGFEKKVRLDKTDAKFVDVIHTDALPFSSHYGFGMIGPYGHVDFYMNGGYEQPGCATPMKRDFLASVLKDIAKYTIGTLSQSLRCSHRRAYKYYLEALNETNNCVFWGHKAFTGHKFNSLKDIHKRGLGGKLSAISSVCTTKDCTPLGLETEKSRRRGVFVVSTNEKAPFCKQEEVKDSTLTEIVNIVKEYSRWVGNFFGKFKVW